MKMQTVTVLFVALLVGLDREANAQMSIENFTAESTPYGVAFDGTSIWVTNYGSNTVTRMRESDGACVVNGNVQSNMGPCTFGVESEPIALLFDGAYIWVANYASASVTMLRASDGSCNGVINPPTAAGCSIPVSANPRFLVSDGANVWVAIQGGSTVYKIQESSGMVRSTYNVGAMPSGLAFDGAAIWVANYLSNTVTKLNPGNGSVLGTFPVSAPHGLAFDGSNIWVTNDLAKGAVTRLRAYDGACVSPCTYDVGINPIGAAFDGANIWVTNYSSNNVTKLRVSDGAVLGTFVVGLNPAGIATNGVDTWVANTSSGTVSKLFLSSPNPNTFIGGTTDWGCGTNSDSGPCWSLGYVANSDHFNDCLIPMTFSVTINVTGACINLTVGASDTLTVNPGYLTLAGTQVDNAGKIADGSSNGITLLAPTTFLSGGGTVSLTTIPGQLQTSIRGINNNTLVNVDNTIQGQGIIGLSPLNLINQKTIVATGGTLTTYGNAITNSGVLEAASGSTLQLTAGGTGYPVVNNTFGTISALDTGKVILFGGIINGGALTTTGSGVIQTSTPATNVTLNNVTNYGAYTNYANTTLQGAVTNNGVIYAPGGGLWISGAATLKGTGIVSGNTGYLIGSVPMAPGGMLFNQSIISGGGNIGDSGLTVTNQGTIDATNTSNHLVLSGLAFTNTGLMEASGGATLEIGTTINNTGGTITAQDGSFVLMAQYGSLGQGAVNGGTFIADGTITGTLNGAGIHQIGLQPGMNLFGHGTVVGDVSSSGIVTAGDSVSSPATLTITGNYTQNIGGALDVTIWGNCTIRPCPLAPFRLSSLLEVGNTIALNGTLNIKLAGFVPQVGTSYTILKGAAISGKFSSVNGLSINSTEHFAISYSSTTVAATVVAGP